MFNASFGAPSIIQQLISLGLSGWGEEHRKRLLLLTSRDLGQTPPRRSGWTGIRKFSRYISPLLSVKILSQGTCCLLRRRGKASKILLFLFFFLFFFHHLSPLLLFLSFTLLFSHSPSSIHLCCFLHLFLLLLHTLNVENDQYLLN